MLKDKDIREPLFEFLEDSFGKIRIIEEKTIGRSRADVMAVTENGLIGIEIKSDADTYTRLESQVRDYNRYFDFNIVAVGSSHAMHITEHVPEYWGIITIDEVDGKPDFYYYRPMSENPKVKRKSQIRILWREELAHIQELNSMPKYKEKSKKFVRDKIVDRIEDETLKGQICEELFQRDYTGIANRIQKYRKKRR